MLWWEDPNTPESHRHSQITRVAKNVESELFTKLAEKCVTAASAPPRPELSSETDPSVEGREGGWGGGVSSQGEMLLSAGQINPLQR